MGKIMVAAMVIVLFLAVWWLPAIIAYARGVRGHRLNTIIMWPGYSVMLLLVVAFLMPEMLRGILGAIVLGIPWVVALVMAFVYKPGMVNRRRV